MALEWCSPGETDLTGRWGPKTYEEPQVVASQRAVKVHPSAKTPSAAPSGDLSRLFK